MKIAECLNCGNEFIKTGQNHKFCCEKCATLGGKFQRQSWNDNFKIKRPANQLVRSAKSRAKSKGIPFDITEDDVVIPTHCPVLGIPIKVNIKSGCGGSKDSISLDRIYPEKGYVKGNIQVMSHLANSMKSSATPEELLKFADWIYKTYGK
jgi:hypothetical protein